VRLHGGGVRVNLDNRNLIPGFVHVLVEGDQNAARWPRRTRRDPARVLARCQVAQA
jgi:hypothetical protein